jgi:hypothetical membrane protein
MEHRRALLLIPAYAALVIVMFALPFFSVDQYSIREHTLSELGAQGAPNAWVMNVVFAALGCASVLDGWPRLRGLWLHRACLVVFGVALFLVALFLHAPIPADAPVSTSEDEWHSTFSGLAGAAFVALAVATFFAGTGGRERWFGPAVAVFASVMSILVFQVPGYAGIWQRLLFLVSFGWLIVFLRRRPRVGALSGLISPLGRSFPSR